MMISCSSMLTGQQQYTGIGHPARIKILRGSGVHRLTGTGGQEIYRRF